MKHLTEFEIRSFRNVRPTKLDLRPGICVVLGKNASGKTTLLKLIEESLIWSAAGFRFSLPRDLAYRGATGDVEFSRRVVRRHVEAPKQLGDVPLREADEFLVSQAGRQVLEVADDGGVLRLDGGRLLGTRFDLVSILEELARRRDPRIDLVVACFNERVRRLDESLEFLRDFSERGPSGDSPLFERMFERAADEWKRQVGATWVEPPVAFLEKVRLLLGYDAATVRIDVQRTAQTNGDAMIGFPSAAFRFTRGGEPRSHDQLSYGEQRLLSFFLLCDVSPNIIIADELVNGLHHEWIKACLDEIGPRQAFLTSQNPLLLDYLEFKDVEDVRKGFILCSRDGDHLIWRNPTREEAQDFFFAYETGVQRISDILITKGLW